LPIFGSIKVKTEENQLETENLSVTKHLWLI
jgi:hypothetical protein